MKLTFSIQVFAGLAMSAIMAGCGGGNTPATAPHVERKPAVAPLVETKTAVAPAVTPLAPLAGIYAGATSTNRHITALVLADDSYYFIYSKPADPASFDGVAFGSGASSNGAFTSSNFKDINLDGAVTTGALSASYDPRKTFAGTLTYSGGATATFSSSYDAVSTNVPSVAGLAGVYTGTLAAEGFSERGIKLTILADGTVAGQISCGCKISANITPIAGSNAYAIRLAFTGGDHPLHDQTFNGSVYLDAAGKRLLLVGVLDATKTPAIFAGERQ